MSSLVNQKIKDTYDGLIKTSDEQPIDGTLKNLQDGNGGVLPIQVSTGGVNFTGTVTGLPAATQGLESGTGTNSMQSGASLTTTPADASGDNSIAIGEGAEASAEGGVAIGESTTADGTDCVAIGRGANSNSESIAIGDGSTNASTRSVAIGRSATAAGNSVSIGNFAQGLGNTNIQIACASVGGMTNNASSAVMIVPGSTGGSTNGFADGAIVIGAGPQTERATANAENGIAIGNGAITDGNNAVALGHNITASTDDTVTIKLLQIANYASMNYADDAAAATGGIPLGGVYHTSGALKIRIA